MIRVYIERNGGTSVMERLDRMRDDTENSALPVDAEADDTQQSILPIDLRMTFVNYLADFTVCSYGLRPTDSQMKNIAQSAVALVPSLASKKSDSEIVIYSSEYKCYLFCRTEIH